LFLNGVDRADVLRLVQRYDVDGDGSISLEEFSAFLISRTNPNKSEWLTVDSLPTRASPADDSFVSADEDGDGADEDDAAAAVRENSNPQSATHKAKIFLQNMKAMLLRRAVMGISSSSVPARGLAGSSGPVFLGLDSSTQGIKATAVSAEGLKVEASFAVNYQAALGAKHALVNGVHAKAGNAVTQPTLLYFEALEMLLQQMKEKGFDFKRVRAVSGSGQQHGSVFWRAGARKTLGGLSAGGGPLAAQLAGAFAVRDSPIWMDSSTGAQCAALEKALGGAQAVASATGSRAYER
jgi:hypothetical protein